MLRPRLLTLSFSCAALLALLSQGIVGCGNSSDGPSSPSGGSGSSMTGGGTAAAQAGSAGAPSSGAPSGTSGNNGNGGSNAAGATAAGASAGGTSSGGAAGSSGMAGRGGTTSGGGAPPATCNSKPVTLNPNPFGCKFAWGASPNGSLANFGYLQFATYWIEGGIKADGTFGSCSGCDWVKNNFATGNAIPVYYAYIIGFMGHAAGLEDGNTCPSGQPDCPNLTNQGATLVRNNRDKIVQAYASYAKQTYAVWPTKPLVWLLEGDFVQYSGTSQSAPLTMSELGSLANDITCAIKGNMPNAVVALNHSNWNPDQITNDYFNAMKDVPYDMVWTTGVADNGEFITSGTNAKSYNGATATYSYVHKLTGKTIWVDDSCGVSAMADSWSTSSAATLNMHIASGVIAFAHCGAPPSSYQTSTAALEPQLMSTCAGMQ